MMTPIPDSTLCSRTQSSHDVAPPAMKPTYARDSNDTSTSNVMSPLSQSQASTLRDVDLEDSRTDQNISEKENAADVLHTWSGPEDPDHPTNWSLSKKLGTTVMLALTTITISLNSAMFAPAVEQVCDEFGVSAEVATLGTTLYLLGFCLGPPFWGPISEKFGRKQPFLIGSGLCALFTLMSGFGRDLGVILVGRFLAGCFGASPATIISGAATDNWGPIGRAINLIVVLSTIFGSPLLAPIIGGFIVGNTTWRWTMWSMVIFGVAVTAFCAIFLPETYPPILLKRRTKRLRETTGDDTIRCEFDNEKTNISVICNVYLVRPWVLFATEPILVFVTIYHAFIYGLLYLYLSAYPFAFGKGRGFAPGFSGLPLLSIHVGILFALGIAVWFIRFYLTTKATVMTNGRVVPECRIPIMIFGALLFPAGLLWFAWTSSNKTIHWMVPTAAGVIIGCGMFSVFSQCLAYMVEVYLPVANSAMASSGIVRAMFGAIFPLFASIMYERLGVAWATSLLAFLGIAMIPVPLVLFFYGERIRGWSKNAVSSTADR